ncbi:MAG: ThiF family adenylyltransferase [Proteobacteria bacterium]|nr:ThiF family adenylyltransferase [Pseudomonadota bacterium]
MLRDFDRQLRIDGWDQDAIDKARLGIVGDRAELTSFFIVAAVALGFKKFKIIAPRMDMRLIDIAKKLSHCSLDYQRGYFSNACQSDFFGDCDAIADLSNYALSKKLLFSSLNIPVVVAKTSEVFSSGRPNGIKRMLSGHSLPSRCRDNSVGSVLLAGIALELIKGILFRQQTDFYLKYGTSSPKPEKARVLQIGAGALGNFTAYLLAPMVDHLLIVDDDEIEATNLNRQVFFYDAVGERKSEILARRLQAHYKLSKGRISGKTIRFDETFDIKRFDVVFDCVDNIQTRAIMSDLCRKRSIPLVHGGTSHKAGQAMFYQGTGTTPAERFHFHETPEQKRLRLDRENSCVRQPDASVIMSNMIVAALMVDLYLKKNPNTVYYQNTGNYLMELRNE